MTQESRLCSSNNSQQLSFFSNFFKCAIIRSSFHPVYSHHSPLAPNLKFLQLSFHIHVNGPNVRFNHSDTCLYPHMFVRYHIPDLPEGILCYFDPLSCLIFASTIERHHASETFIFIHLFDSFILYSDITSWCIPLRH